jgi:hypothetical protein
MFRVFILEESSSRSFSLEVKLGLIPLDAWHLRITGTRLHKPACMPSEGCNANNVTVGVWCAISATRIIEFFFSWGSILTLICSTHFDTIYWTLAWLREKLRAFSAYHLPLKCPNIAIRSVILYISTVSTHLISEIGSNVVVLVFQSVILRQSQWLSCVSRGYATTCLLGLRVRIPAGGLDDCCECCVLSGTGLGNKLIIRPEES